MGFLKFYFLIMGWFLDLKLKRVAIAGGWGGIIVIVRLTVCLYATTTNCVFSGGGPDLGSPSAEGTGAWRNWQTQRPQGPFL